MPPDHELHDDVVLRRSWPELYDHVVRRGTALRRRRRLAVLSPALVVAAALVVGLAVRASENDEEVRTGPATTTDDEPVLDQQVAFVRVFDGGDGGTAIFVVDGDGSGLRRLSPDEGLRDGAAAFSPDGEWIAFQSERDNPQRDLRRVTDVYLMRPDGTGVRRVTTTADPGLGNGVRHPAWSPDGASLAVAAEDDADVSRIVVLRPDGSEAHAITEGPGDVGPVWSPDGRWIAFRRRPGGAEELWVVRPDGSDARRVVGPVHDGPVAWTPDGTRLTYAAELPDGRTRLFTVGPDGAGQQQVSVGPGLEDFEPAWSVDGTLLVYSDDPDGEYLVTSDPGAPLTTTGGREPGRLVVALPGREVVGTLTAPEDGDQDRGPSLAPSRG